MQGEHGELWSGVELLAALTVAARWMEQHVPALNALNVFPVPDGDTGTNLALTLNGAIRDVSPDPSCAVVSERVRYWAMLRGRGNSGIILSQALHGIALALASHTQLGPRELVDAIMQGSTTAYQAVIKPVEGTMLTVLREAGIAASATLASGEATLAGVLESAVHGARVAVEHTPMLLKVLRDAGVVDAGGQGVVILLEGLLRYARGEPEEAGPALVDSPASDWALAHAEVAGYCTNFVVRGSGMPFEWIRAGLAAMGDSAMIVGDDQLIKVHLHLMRPGVALDFAAGFGALDQIDITNMDLQQAAFATGHHKDLPAHTAPPGIVAVAPGPGFAAIFRSLNAGAIVDGGISMNPSPQEYLDAIARIPHHEVIVLPNSGNALMSAQQAAQMADRRVEVLDSRTAPQGIAALLALKYQLGMTENLVAMRLAARQVRTAEITFAARDSRIGDVAVRAGQTIGLLDGNLVTVGDHQETVINELLECTRDALMITIYYGQSIDHATAEILARQIGERYPEAEVEIQHGGQYLYDYILSLE